MLKLITKHLIDFVEYHKEKGNFARSVRAENYARVYLKSINKLK
jgi:uncharacterized protein YfdQ (DUF2303 family)